MKRKEDSCKIY